MTSSFEHSYYLGDAHLPSHALFPKQCYFCEIHVSMLEQNVSKPPFYFFGYWGPCPQCLNYHGLPWIASGLPWFARGCNGLPWVVAIKARVATPCHGLPRVAKGCQRAATGWCNKSWYLNSFSSVVWWWGFQCAFTGEAYFVSMASLFHSKSTLAKRPLRKNGTKVTKCTSTRDVYFVGVASLFRHK